MDIKDIQDLNEPAFPRVVNGIAGETKEVWYGMTLRDYFAAKALQGELANAATEPRAYNSLRDMDNLSGWCYDMADAMLRARAK